MGKMQKLGLLVAAYLINNRGDISEQKLMTDLRNQIKEYPNLSAITPLNVDGFIPDVAVILRHWIHAGIVGLKGETPYDTKFYLRDIDALVELIIG